MSSNLNLVIAGGKTGGHLFPGIAVAQAVRSLVPDAGLLFIGTKAPFEINTLKKYGFAHKPIFSRPIKGGNLFGKVFSVSLILISLLQALWILRSFKPDFVLGVGGFSSFAVLLAARLLNIPTGIQEQNAVPGLTNRMLAGFAGTIFTSFEVTKGFEKHPKVNFVGNPVRKMPVEETPNDHLGLDYYSDSKPTILVTGGSQGARSINKAFAEALTLLENPDQYNLIHQTGALDEADIKAAYQAKGFKLNVGAFFDNMPQLMKRADLVIARAGAGTIFELAQAGTPTIFVPFPYAADNHQKANAKSLEKKGAAVMIKDEQLTGKLLKETITELFNSKEKLSQMAQNMKAAAMPDADIEIANYIIRTKGLKG